MRGSLISIVCMRQSPPSFMPSPDMIVRQDDAVLTSCDAILALPGRRYGERPNAPDFEAQQVNQLEFTPGQERRYLQLRRAGMSFGRAVNLAARPPAFLIRGLTSRRLRSRREGSRQKLAIGLIALAMC